MTNIVVKKKNEVYIKVHGEQHVHHELADYFSFEVPEAKFLKRNLCNIGFNLTCILLGWSIILFG